MDRKTATVYFPYIKDISKIQNIYDLYNIKIIFRGISTLQKNLCLGKPKNMTRKFVYSSLAVVAKLKLAT